MKILSISLLIVIAPLSIFSQSKAHDLNSVLQIVNAPEAKVVNYLKQNGFKSNGADGIVKTYKKESESFDYEFSVVIRNGLSTTISYTEPSDYLQNIYRVILTNGFRISQAGAGIYGFKNHEKNLVISLVTKPQNGALAITIGLINPSKAANIVTKTVVKSAFFQGTRKFCTSDDSWNYMVTIKGSTITVRLYPGASNEIHKNKSLAKETFTGYIKDDKIYVKVDGEYSSTEFKLKDNILYRANYEDGYNDYQQCR
jgi:hypothetical protein